MASVAALRRPRCRRVMSKTQSPGREENLAHGNANCLQGRVARMDLFRLERGAAGSRVTSHLWIIDINNSAGVCQASQLILNVQGQGLTRLHLHRCKSEGTHGS